MDGGAWWATVHGVEKSRTRLSDFTFTFTFMLIVSGSVGCGIVLNFGGSFLGLLVFLIFLEGDVGGIWLYNGYGY